MCAISIDRRLTDGETYQMALKEIEELESVKRYGAKVTMYDMIDLVIQTLLIQLNVISQHG